MKVPGTASSRETAFSGLESDGGLLHLSGKNMQSRRSVVRHMKVTVPLAMVDNLLKDREELDSFAVRIHLSFERASRRRRAILAGKCAWERREDEIHHVGVP